MKPTCKQCAKHEDNGGSGCDNLDMRPIRFCFKATEKAEGLESIARDLEEDKRHGN